MTINRPFARGTITPSLAAVIAGAITSLSLCLACAGEPGSTESGITSANNPPVILISIDTLRSDRLPIYGYDAVETPAIDRLRNDATLFAHAYTHVPLTLPAHASMLTGRFPYEHGIRDNQGYVLGPEWPTLPEILAARGYRTGAAVSTFILRTETGIARGFEHYDDDIASGPANQIVSPLRPGIATLEPARAWLADVKDEPFFLFFHIYEPHRPYQPSEPFAARYGVGYDAEVATADHVIGELLEILRQQGRYDEALIILTSDHGEGLGDHDAAEHGPLLYREVLQIPLVIKLPAGTETGTETGTGAGATSEQPAQLVDLMPTILDLVGAEDELESLPGVALLAADDASDGAERMLYAETLFPRLHFGWSELHSLIDYPFHYIHGPDPELYDLATDPGETRNVLAENRRVYRAMADELARLPTDFAAPEPVDEEARAQLDALGYIGSASDATSDRLRADPKTKLPVLRALSQAFNHFRQGDCPATVQALERVLVEEQEIIEAWEYLGRCQLRLGKVQEALAAYKKMLTITGGNAKAALGAASAFLRLGRFEDAKVHAEMAADSQPVAYNILAQVAIQDGDLDAADRALAQAMQSSLARPNALLGKAEVALRREDPSAALDLVRQAEAAAPEPLEGIELTRGKALAEMGEVEQAMKALWAAIEENPREIAPYAHLALVRGLAGDGQGAVDTLRAMVEAIPAPPAYAEAVRTLRLLGDQESAARLLQFALGKWPRNAGLRSL